MFTTELIDGAVKPFIRGFVFCHTVVNKPRYATVPVKVMPVENRAGTALV